jgi:hypothetical protein
MRKITNFVELPKGSAANTVAVSSVFTGPTDGSFTMSLKKIRIVDVNGKRWTISPGGTGILYRKEVSNDGKSSS